jgi:hypothetical protein
LNETGDIDRLILTGASRRFIEEDKPPLEVRSPLTERFYSIEGDYFVLKAATIKTLSVHFLEVKKLLNNFISLRSTYNISNFA